MIGSLLLALGIPLAVGFLSSRAAGPPAAVRAYYAAIPKPAWAPSPGVFAPVWTALYASTGLASWLVFRSTSSARGAALAWYVAQLALSAFWTPAFFAMHRPGVALALLLALLLAAAQTARLFWRADRRAGALLLPYLAWLAFAAALNAAVARASSTAAAAPTPSPAPAAPASVAHADS